MARRGVAIVEVSGVTEEVATVGVTVGVTVAAGEGEEAEEEATAVPGEAEAGGTQAGGMQGLIRGTGGKTFRGFNTGLHRKSGSRLDIAYG
jgi:hypothetical protein